MNKSRMEAFSDGVIAILITIMVFDLKPPIGADWAALCTVLPTTATYMLSFVYLGIYWNNHHHMLQVTSRVNGAVLWANLHLLFWLSMLPFATGWLRTSGFAALPASVYGCVLLLAAIAYIILQSTIIRANGPNSVLGSAVDEDVKGKISLVLYGIGIASSYLNPWIAVGCYILVAMIWFIPDRRIESTLSGKK